MSRREMDIKHRRERISIEVCGTAVPMMSPYVRMNVICKIDRIRYRVVYEGGAGATAVEPSVNAPQKKHTVANIAFIQYKPQKDSKTGRIRVSYYLSGDPSVEYAWKEYYTDWSQVMAKIEEQTGVVFFIKNMRRSLLLANVATPPPRLYCFDTYVKYNVKLPLYIYGRLSKRFRIPTADEFYASSFATERLGVKKPADYAVHNEHGQIRAVFKDVCAGMMDVIHDSDSTVTRIVEYYFLSGYEASQIVYLYQTLRERKAVSEDCIHPIQYVPKHTKGVENRYECIIEGAGGWVLIN